MSEVEETQSGVAYTEQEQEQEQGRAFPTCLY